MKPSVFISSTYSDLKNVREELSNFIESKGYVSVLNEHGDIGYISGTPLDESCYDAMGNCHMAILVVGGRYGSPATGEDDNDKFSEYLSITRKEFRKAKDSSMRIQISSVLFGIQTDTHFLRHNLVIVFGLLMIFLVHLELVAPLG